MVGGEGGGANSRRSTGRPRGALKVQSTPYCGRHGACNTPWPVGDHAPRSTAPPACRSRALLRTSKPSRGCWRGPLCRPPACSSTAPSPPPQKNLAIKGLLWSGATFRTSHQLVAVQPSSNGVAAGGHFSRHPPVAEQAYAKIGGGLYCYRIFVRRRQNRTSRQCNAVSLFQHQQDFLPACLPMNSATPPQPTGPPLRPRPGKHADPTKPSTLAGNSRDQRTRAGVNMAPTGDQSLEQGAGLPAATPSTQSKEDPRRPRGEHPNRAAYPTCTLASQGVCESKPSPRADAEWMGAEDVLQI